MNSHRAGFRFAVWAAATVVSCGVIFPTHATEARKPPPIPVINWAPCADFDGAECATASVPLDYDDPRGATTPVALARIPATDQVNKLGTVFVNPGGPGGSGVNLVLFGFGAELGSLLQGRFDIVGFDPRGIGDSDPIQCFDSNEESNAFFAPLEVVFPYLPGQARPYFDVYKAYGAQCVARNQKIRAHMSTADVVRDLDLLRQAVGDKRLTYLGFSYGTYIGNTYANLFPGKVRALVIDGVLDPRLWSSGAQIVSDRVATAKEFDEFLRLCDEAEADCALDGPEGAAARYQALVDSLRESPLDLGGFLYSYDFLVADSVGSMYSPEFWGGPFGDGAYFGALADAALGVPGATQKAAELRQVIAERTKQNSPQRADYNNSTDAYYGNQCADTQYPRTLAGFSVVAAFAAAGSIYGPYWWWGNNGCAAWPVNADRYIGPWATRTSAPVLVVGNYFDGVTDYDGAVASSRLLVNSRLLTYAGWGHTAFGRSECVTNYVVSYLASGALPPAGTVCPANPNPFVLSDRLSRSSSQKIPLIGTRPPTLVPGRH